jgi:hypothetical protein
MTTEEISDMVKQWLRSKNYGNARIVPEGQPPISLRPLYQDLLKDEGVYVELSGCGFHYEPVSLWIQIHNRLGTVMAFHPGAAQAFAMVTGDVSSNEQFIAQIHEFLEKHYH